MTGLTAKSILERRLANQHITTNFVQEPEEIVAHLVAMQSQEWAMAKWAIGLRLPSAKESDIERAFNEGRILRTHVMRPTWHFVTPADIRPLLELTAPRVHQLNQLYYRKMELDDALLKKTRRIMDKALRDKQYKTREELNALFTKAGIHRERLGLSYIMMHAELDGVICSGPRIGKQFSYALIDEVAPTVKKFYREEALHHIATRYFATRGPAAAQDFAWWSGLTMTEAKKAIQDLPDSFQKENWNGTVFAWKENNFPKGNTSGSTFLIPDYDEYGIAYKDRTIYHHAKWTRRDKTGPAELSHSICLDGYMAGNWSKSIQKKEIHIETRLFHGLPESAHRKIEKATKRFIDFHDTI